MKVLRIRHLCAKWVKIGHRGLRLSYANLSQSYPFDKSLQLHHKEKNDNPIPSNHPQKKIQSCKLLHILRRCETNSTQETPFAPKFLLVIVFQRIVKPWHLWQIRDLKYPKNHGIHVYRSNIVGNEVIGLTNLCWKRWAKEHCLIGEMRHLIPLEIYPQRSNPVQTWLRNCIFPLRQNDR